MQFNSYSYLALLVVTAAIFWALPVRYRRPHVLAASIAFYATWNVWFLLVPFALCGTIFLAARKIASGAGGRLWYVSTIAGAVACLALFRGHEGFARWLALIEQSARVAPGRTLFGIAVPLGISFYILEAISYLIDVRQRRINPERFSDLYLLVMFWSHLMAGPIVRFKELAPQLDFRKRFDVSMLIGGLDRLIWGLVQKNVLADPLGRFVSEGFLPQISTANTWLDDWFLAVAFGLQVYFDFAAYSNMAIGAARLIGIDLPENFGFPYHAKNPANFWQRWHITLSRWIRDYLFFPINVRFAARPLPLYASLLGIMFVVGLWHGIGWGFALWGVMHGCYLVAYRVWEGRQGAHSKSKLANASRFSRALWQMATLVAVTAAWIPFRAVGLGQVAHMLHAMFFTFNPTISFSLDFYLVTLLVAAVCAAEPLLREAIARIDNLAMRHTRLTAANSYLLRPALYALGLLLFLMFDERSTQFIYFQF